MVGRTRPHDPHDVPEDAPADVRADGRADGRADSVARLRAAGLKVTAPRRALLDALVADTSHPSAEQLFERLRSGHASLSLSTVYHGLESFLAAGLCRRVATEDGRLRVDGRVDDHDHAVCVACGSIFDVDRAHFPRPDHASRLPGGLVVTDVRVEYEVTCRSCRSFRLGGRRGRRRVARKSVKNVPARRTGR